MVCRCHLAAVLLLSMAVVSATAQERWKEVRSQKFSIVTDAGERQGCEIARRFEQFHSALGALTGRTEGQEPAPVQIVLFRSGGELRAFAPLREGKPIPVAAVFAWSTDRNYIGLDASSHNLWDNVGHEYTHAQLLGALSETPLWFEEGFAQFYSTTKLEGDKGRIGSPPKGTAAALRFKKLWPVEDLFAVTADSPEYAEPRLRPLFYAQAWLLVHMLVMQGKIDQMRAYASLQSQGVSIVESINQAFHLTPEQLDLDLEQYRKHVSVRTVPVLLAAREVSCSTRGLEQVEVAAFLAEFHAHEPGYEKVAASELEAVLRQAPGNARALAGLGFLAFQRGDWEVARRFYEPAAQHDPGNAHAVYYSIFLRREVGDSLEAGDVTTFRERLQRVVNAEPGWADAHALLAWAQAAEGDSESAARSLALAVRLAPGSEAYLAQLADLHARPERPERAGAAVPAGPPERSSPKPFEDAVGWVGPRPPLVPGNRQETSAAFDPREIQYARGRLLESDCSSWPRVRMKMLIAGEAWLVEVRDAARLLLINADSFSCAWTNREVSLNFRWREQLTADAVSLELRDMPPK